MVTSQLLAHNYPMPKSNSRSLKRQGSLVSQIWRFATYGRHGNQNLLRNSPQIRRSELISQAQPKLGSLLHNARLRTGLSFRAAAAISREAANLLGDERYYVSPGSLSDYEALDTPPRHFHKIITFCLVYSLRLDSMLEALGLSPQEAGTDSIPDRFVSRASTRRDRFCAFGSA